MTTSIEQIYGKVPVTILAIHGDLDASNYLDVIAKAKEAYAAGTRNLIIDMSDMAFMASSGLVALHSISLLMQGEEPPDPQHGWGAFHALDRGAESGPQGQVKLLNPQPKVERSLEITGLKEFFEIYTNLETAIASFE
jgi:anti-anti-sigma regulatory factor